jgi:hypothetical protein
MKKVYYLLTCCCSLVASAQHYDGVYMGRLLSDNNALVIETAASTLVATLHLNRVEKIIFTGTLAEGALSGSFKHSNKTWTLNGKFRNDSLIINLSSEQEIISARLKKISAKPSFNFKKLLNEPSLLRDMQLVGTWRLLYSVKDGVKQPLPPDIRELRKTYRSNGTCEIRSNETSKLYAQYPHLIPSCTWETRGNKLIVTTTGRHGAFSSEVTYLIKGDTLITTNDKNVSSYSLRIGK